jgi:hypothetical protein
VPEIDPCPVLSSAMKQFGPSTVNVPTGVATLHWLATKLTENMLGFEPTSFAVIVHAPRIWVPEAESPLGLPAQAAEKIVSMIISASLFIPPPHWEFSS